MNKSKIYKHKIKIYDYEIIIYFKDNLVAVVEEEEELIDIKDLKFYKLESIEAIKKSEQFKTEKQVEFSKLSLFFWEYLNEEPYLEDCFLSTDFYNRNTIFYTEYYKTNKSKKEEIEVGEILNAITTYYNLPNGDVEFLEEEYLLYPENEIYKRFFELLLSVWRFVGTNLEYNDGAYNRMSGYSELGEIFNLQSNLPDNLTDKEYFMLLKSNNNNAITEAKKTIILWLYQFRPLGIKNLKQLEKYLFN